MSAHLLSRVRQRRLLDQQLRTAVEAALAGGATAAGPRSAPADPRRLRGIPVIGVGVDGAVRGSRPEHAVR